MVKLSSLIAPNFFPIHQDIKAHKHTHYKLYGGRGSTKSSFVSVEIITGMMQDSQANAAVFRRVGNTLQESVYEQLLWAIEMLGVAHLWKASLSPLRLTYKPTGQQILFRGCDDPNRTKSIKLRKGYFRFIWFEERAEFDGDEDERKILQSLMRGGPLFTVFYTWNPPKQLQSWVNQDVLEERPDTLCNHSTYLTVPKDWLGEQFFLEAEDLKRRKPMSFRHEYLGEATGTGGRVFDNVVVRRITDEEVARFDRIRQGLDFGFAADPLAFEKMHYNRSHRKLYIFGEVYAVNLKTREAVRRIKALDPENHYTTADSEEPRSIDSFNEEGLRLIPAKKGPGSVDHGMRWLSEDLDEIVIDPVRCPNAMREFTSYELERDRNGNFKGSYPDKDNHSIDAVRYAMEADMTRRKARVGKRSRVTGG